ncbi:hypothetical protein D9V32_01195 [Mycetocola tolaasinivorans]|uniref:Zinc finger CGNR domain-containing protein n=1 Tax=Mycetocola tolaasinivorans TaxID=76635 RepID=A0A3L7ABW1_9MICO|nr:ABATE domain-containing protein [Mycetocola tolaasinivorans]RLP77976.1 hypothetical protein D9V32_01195 [Mycetocola tolaasinivorans]
MKHAFPCGSLPLDLVGTLRARRNEVPAECLGVPADVDDWLAQSGILPGAASTAASSAATLTAALALRESIYALVWARLHEEPLPAEAVRELNEFATAPALGAALTDAGWEPRGTPEYALGSIAREAVAIIGGPDSALLRECSRPECTQVYLDHSRGHRREWCSMKTCGSRVKAAAYRARKREEAAA